MPERAWGFKSPLGHSQLRNFARIQGQFHGFQGARSSLPSALEAVVVGRAPRVVSRMTAESIIPALVHPVRDTVASVARSGEISGLPLPRLATLPHERPMLYGMATLDRGGRIGDRRIMRALGWRPDEHLDVTLVDEVMLIRPHHDGRFRVPPGLLAVIPAPVRHWCALSPGDRVLLAADLERGVLVVHTTTTLDRLVLAHHATVFGGDDT